MLSNYSLCYDVTLVVIKVPVTTVEVALDLAKLAFSKPDVMSSFAGILANI